MISCEKPSQTAAESSSDVNPSSGAEIEPAGIPKTLDEAVALILSELTDEDRQFIISGGEDYEWMLPSHGGMGMRNSWGLWGDSPLSRHFLRMGIYHPDDMSSIVCQVVSRKVRAVPVDLDGIVEYYRKDWEEHGIVAPLDLNCPDCGKEMRIEHVGDGVSAEQPKRTYFSGRCPDGLIYYFYHTDGWIPEDKFNKVHKAEEPTPNPPSD